MSTTTAFILIGHAHQNDSGIIASHLIRFTENSRPALILTELKQPENEYVFIPSANTIDDIYLVVAVYVLKMVKPSKELTNIERDEIDKIIPQEERVELYRKTKEVLSNHRIKIVFNILDECSLLNQIDVIKKYPNDFEVTLPGFKKEFSTWGRKVITKGF